MLGYLIENLKDYLESPRNFRVTRNVPIDTRFCVTTMDALNDEIPLSRRYGGLIFYTDKKLYYFSDDDLTTPILLLDDSVVNPSVYEFFVDDDADYSTVLNLLQPFESSIGRIVYIRPLGIGVLYNGTTWQYFGGVYTVPDETSFNTIPDSLIEIGAKVETISDGKDHVIDSSGNLSDYVISATELPVTLEENRFYNINGIIYFASGGNAHKFSSSSYIADVNLISGNNTVTHNLASAAISVFFNIFAPSGNPFMPSSTQSIDYQPINDNSIRIVSKAAVSGNIRIFGH